MFCELFDPCLDLVWTPVHLLIGLFGEEGLDSSNFGMTEKNETVWIKWDNVEQCGTMFWLFDIRSF